MARKIRWRAFVRNTSWTAQIDESTCGAGMASTLMSPILLVTPQQIVDACGADRQMITDNGMEPNEISHAIEAFLPDHTLYLKREVTIGDIFVFLSQAYPVGVLCQGLFHATSIQNSPIREDGDDGHYVTVYGIDIMTGMYHVLDPARLRRKPLIVPFDEFHKRMWSVGSKGGKGSEIIAQVSDRERGLALILSRPGEEEMFVRMGCFPASIYSWGP